MSDKKLLVCGGSRYNSRHYIKEGLVYFYNKVGIPNNALTIISPDDNIVTPVIKTIGNANNIQYEIVFSDKTKYANISDAIRNEKIFLEHNILAALIFDDTSAQSQKWIDKAKRFDIPSIALDMQGLAK